MKKPKVSIENYESVYDYYAEKGPSPRFVNIAQSVLSVIYRPKVIYAVGADQEITDHIESSGALVLASNHVNIHDQFVIASLVKREEPLKPMVANTVIPAKASLFKHRLLRDAVDGMGSIPTFRDKDILDKSGNLTEKRQTLKRSADSRLIRAMIASLENGRNLAMFPEGTRNTTDPSQVQKIHRGIGLMAYAASRHANIAILPIGILYGRSPFVPDVAIGRLIPADAYKNSAELTAKLQDEMQECVNTAALIHQS